MNAITKEQDHAYQNAAGWASSIAEMVAALECDYDRLEELRGERTDLADQWKEAGDEYHAAAAPGSPETNDEIRALQLAEMNAHNFLNSWDEGNAEELAELTAGATIDGDIQTDAEGVRERIQDSPLSIEVRSGWVSPGCDVMVPEDFCILLSTGGPALRIRGELDQYKQPRRAWLEYQDWGTPWTEYHGEGCEHSTLLTFCQQFYFGE